MILDCGGVFMRVVFCIFFSFFAFAKLAVLDDIQKAKRLAYRYNRPICQITATTKGDLALFLENRSVGDVLQNRCLFVINKLADTRKIDILDEKGEVFACFKPSAWDPEVLALDIKGQIQKLAERGL